MNRNLKSECGNLSIFDLENLYFEMYWKKINGIARIPYTFNISYIPSNLAELVNYTNLTVVPRNVRQLINASLGAWEKACDLKVEFIHQKNPSASMIIFATANLKNVSGLTSSPLVDPTKTTIFLDLSLLPVYGKEMTQLTITHEIGHALGFRHVHDLPDLVYRMGYLKQGLGCSVMPYHWIIRYTKMKELADLMIYLQNNDAIPSNLTSNITFINELMDEINCTTKEICGNQPFAIYPGPWDSLICQHVYNVPCCGAGTHLENGQCVPTNVTTAMHGFISGAVIAGVQEAFQQARPKGGGNTYYLGKIGTLFVCLLTTETAFCFMTEAVSTRAVMETPIEIMPVVARAALLTVVTVAGEGCSYLEKEFRDSGYKKMANGFWCLKQANGALGFISLVSSGSSMLLTAGKAVISGVASYFGGFFGKHSVQAAATHAKNLTNSSHASIDCK